MNNKVEKILAALENNENQVAPQVINENLGMLVQNSVGNFIIGVMEKMTSDSQMEELIKETLQKKIKMGDIKTSELIHLLNQIQIRKDDTANTLLNFLKPSGTEQTNVFMSKEAKKDEEEGVISNFTSEDLKVFEELKKILEQGNVLQKTSDILDS